MMASNAPVPVTILGSTGSVGKSAIRVLESQRQQFSVFGLAAGTDSREMYLQCRALRPQIAAMADSQAADDLRTQLDESGLGSSIEVRGGPDAPTFLAQQSQGIVVAAITGIAGLDSLQAAVQSAKRVLLANKEALVVGGQILLDMVHQANTELIPLDSEHNAVMQCLGADFSLGKPHPRLKKVSLTASGGPFRQLSLAEMEQVSPEDALRHPVWDMGAKISVDSATLLNKGLELIEASILFGLEPEQLDVLVHPESAIHALIHFSDGSSLAHLAHPDMQIPIAHALAWPDRLALELPALDLAHLGLLNFEYPDLIRFPCLKLAMDVLKEGGSKPVVLNAANEVAVAAFLAKRLKFVEIAQLVSWALFAIEAGSCSSLHELAALDERVRSLCNERLRKMG